MKIDKQVSAPRRLFQSGDIADVRGGLPSVRSFARETGRCMTPRGDGGESRLPEPGGCGGRAEP